MAGVPLASKRDWIFDRDAGGRLLAETKASEPVIPLALFRNPIIAICSLASFVWA